MGSSLGVCQPHSPASPAINVSRLMEKGQNHLRIPQHLLPGPHTQGVVLVVGIPGAPQTPRALHYCPIPLGLPHHRRFLSNLLPGEATGDHEYQAGIVLYLFYCFFTALQPFTQ